MQFELYERLDLAKVKKKSSIKLHALFIGS